MAKKSKTQRAKASANRAAKKAQVDQGLHAATALPTGEAHAEPKLSREAKKLQREQEKKAEKAAKLAAKRKKKPSFLVEVKNELKRVTWPTRSDVLRWSAVVIMALLFFGIFTLVLDNEIVSRLLYGIASIGV